MMLKDRSTGKSIRAKPATMKARVYGTVAKRDGLGYFWRNSTPRFHLTLRFDGSTILGVEDT